MDKLLLELLGFKRVDGYEYYFAHQEWGLAYAIWPRWTFHYSRTDETMLDPEAYIPVDPYQWQLELEKHMKEDGWLG